MKFAVILLGGLIASISGKASTLHDEGMLACLNISTGKVEPARNAAGVICIGTYAETVDLRSGGTDIVKICRPIRAIAAAAGTTRASVGKPAYVGADAYTATAVKPEANPVVVGLIVDVADGEIWLDQSVAAIATAQAQVDAAVAAAAAAAAQDTADDAVPASQLGVANGVATLGANSKLTASQVPT
jgi:hypothetical protein